MIPGTPATSPAHSITAERVLIVDDEPDIVALAAYHLARAGYRVSTAGNGSDGLAQAQAEPPALVVLDVMLPGRSGFEVLQELRAAPATAATPVLLLTARRDEPDRLRGLSLGADDYLTKPFSPLELVLRVAAILRRTAAPAVTPSAVITVGPIRIDRASHEVTSSGSAIDLTPIEFKLLLTLAERKGHVLPRSVLLETVWDAHPDIQTRTVDMHILRVRVKLGRAGELIETVRGFGYRINSGRLRKDVAGE